MINITFPKNITKSATESLTPPADDYSSAKILRAIETIERHLRVTRSRIKEILIRRDRLVDEYRQLTKTLESENICFAQSLRAAINDLNTDGKVVGLLDETPSTTEQMVESSDDNIANDSKA